MKKYLSLFLAALLVITAFAGCAKKSSVNYPEEVMKVNGTPVFGNDYNFVLTNIANSVLTNYNQAVKKASSFQEIANETYTENKTYGDFIKEYARSSVVRNVVISNYFTELGLKFTYDDEQAFNKELNAQYKQAGGKKEYAKRLEENYGARLEDLENFELIRKKFNMIFEHLYGPGGEKEITEEVAMDKFKNEAIRVKHILVKTVDDSFTPLTGDKLAAAESKYKEALAATKALKSGDMAAFDALIEKYGEDPGMEGSPEGYVIDKNTSFVKEFLDTSFTLDVGQIGECKSDYGYHIIMRYDLRDTDLTSFLQLKTEKQDASIDDYIESLKDEAINTLILDMTDKAEVEVVNQTVIDKINNRFLIKK